MTSKLEALTDWVNQVAALTRPARIHWCDGSQDEYQSLVQQMLAQLGEIGLVTRAESGEWLLARDLDDLSLAELYEACNLRIPINEAHLPCRDDALGQNAIRTLDELRIPLRELLKRRVSSLYDLPGEPP